jgi:hypothetical protein
MEQKSVNVNNLKKVAELNLPGMMDHHLVKIMRSERAG